MYSKEKIEQSLNELKREFGDWTYDIPLPFGIWTRGDLEVPHTRLKRIVQIVSDLSGKLLSNCRILDLGCLDGIFSIEFALHGAQTLGVEIRDGNIQKAIFCKEVLGLRNLKFRQDDVRNISMDAYGRFDAVICSGLLYHLPAADVFKLVSRMFEMVTRVVVVDTHIALEPKERFQHNDQEYWGRTYREHSDDATCEMKAKSLLASADNNTSFWFTRPSLINILTEAGFSSVYECFVPTHINFGRPGLEHRDRCTFVGIKDELCTMKTSPAANSLRERWPEQSLAYSADKITDVQPKPSLGKAFRRLKRMIG